MPLLIGAAVVVLVLLLGLIISYNGLVRRRAGVNEAFATMDVYLKRRYDLVPNLVETVKAFTAHEKDTLEALVRGRNHAISAGNMAQRIEGEKEMTQALSRLFAVAESYPQLRSSDQYLTLQQELSQLESDIAQARRYYNGTVRELNMKTEMFPSNIVAALFGFKPYPYFEAEEQERESQKVHF